MGLGRPGTDQVQRLPALGAVAGVTQGLAVDGDVLEAQGAGQRLHPPAEAGLEGLRVEAVEDALQGVVRGDAVGQAQEGLQPGAAASGKGDGLLPVLGTTDDGTERDGDDVQQEVSLEVVAARVAEAGEVAGHRQRGRGHASSP